MIFDQRFLEISEVLNVRYQRYAATKPNSADVGELCESFIRDALEEITEGSLRPNEGVASSTAEVNGRLRLTW